MPSTTVPALFQPIQVGDIKLSHRVVLAPLTRLRADSAHVPTDMVQEYYVQRARVPGTPGASPRPEQSKSSERTYSTCCPSGGFRARPGLRPRRVRLGTRYLVDSASSHMLVSKIKPCMSKYKQFIR